MVLSPTQAIPKPIGLPLTLTTRASAMGAITAGVTAIVGVSVVFFVSGSPCLTIVLPLPDVFTLAYVGSIVIATLSPLISTTMT